MKKLTNKEYKKIAKACEQIKLQSDIDVPHSVWTAFSSDCKQIRLMGDQLTFGCDYVTLEQARSAIEFYVDQLGGKVKWKK